MCIRDRPQAKATGDINWLKNSSAYLQDIYDLEVLPEGKKDKSYILSDLHNALGMLSIHQQDWTDNPQELRALNERVLKHFSEFVRLNSNPGVESGQEANLVAFLKASPDNMARPIIPREGRSHELHFAQSPHETPKVSQ